MLNKGQWEGKQVLSPESVRSMVSSQYPEFENLNTKDSPPVGLGWRLNTNGFYESLTKDAYFSSGPFHQLLLVIPSEDIVLVRMGDPVNGVVDQERFWLELDEAIFTPLMEAIAETN